MPLSLFVYECVCVCVCVFIYIHVFDSRWWIDFRSNVNFIHEMYVRMHVHVPLIMSTTFFSPKNTIIIQRIYFVCFVIFLPLFSKVIYFCWFFDFWIATGQSFDFSIFWNCLQDSISYNPKLMALLLQWHDFNGSLWLHTIV